MVSSSNRGAIIKIYSEPGEGTTVKIYLPRLDAAPDIQSESAQDKTPLDAAESGESILVVEDDYLLRSYMVETLRDLGYLSSRRPTRRVRSGFSITPQSALT